MEQPDEFPTYVVTVIHRVPAPDLQQALDVAKRMSDSTGLAARISRKGSAKPILTVKANARPTSFIRAEARR